MREYSKICVYVPEEHRKHMIDVIKALTVNHIGNYENCISWHPVYSTWTPTDGASPYIEEVGNTTSTHEYKIEFLCDTQANLDRVTEVIRNAHPYEEPVIEVFTVNLL